MTVSPAAIGLPTGGLSLEAAQSQTMQRCSRGFQCGGAGAVLEHAMSLLEGVCCCCRAGTRHHD